MTDDITAQGRAGRLTSPQSGLRPLLPRRGWTRAARSGPARLRSLIAMLFAGTALLALAACETGGTSADGSGALAKPQRSTRLVERDVEAPQVFQVSETALWDGRPSLGGVWVASPEVTDPERVIMRNPANGKFVIGALFKRERDNPGPKLQISSDAADALGLLAGQPATLSVTALRREEAPETPPATPILDSNESLASATTQATAGAIDGGGVTSKPLDAPAAGAGSAATVAGAAAAISAAEASGADSAKPPAAAKPAAASAAGASPAPAASAAGRPIQIGFFSVEANATRAVDTLAKAGIQASKRKDSAQGKDYWTVATRGDAALLKKIKAAGFADAYLLK